MWIANWDGQKSNDNKYCQGCAKKKGKLLHSW